jgi:hypothetical protein
MLPLRDVQLRFFAAITRGGPVDAGLRAVVREHGTLDAAARIEIYADMYRARLVDVLREDFPRVCALLGDEAFSTVAGRYLACHPSSHPSVRHLGHRFAGHLATERLPQPFLADLAHLEWARVEVFDAPDPEPLRLADLAAIAPTDWPALTLRPIAACRVVSSAWPVHEIWAAAADGDAGGTWPAAPTTVRVWREGWSVSHAAMGAVEGEAFGILRRGVPFAEVCAAAEAGREPDAAAREVGALLMRWLEDGLLARLPER